MTYTPNTDAKLSYLAALAEIRRRGVASGKYPPRNDEERALVEEECTY